MEGHTPVSTSGSSNKPDLISQGSGVPWKMWFNWRAMPKEGNMSIKPTNYNMFKELWYHFCFQRGPKYSNILIFFCSFVIPNCLWKVFTTFIPLQPQLIHVVLDFLRNCIWDSVSHRNSVRLCLFTGFFKLQAAVCPGCYNFCCKNVQVKEGP